MGFCTVADIRAFLQIEIEDDDASALRAIVEATAAIQNYTHQAIEQTEDDEVALDVAAGQRRLFLPELPVTEAAEVVEDDETLTAGADEDYQLGNHGILYRVGRNWAAGVQIVTVTYTHGWAEIPQDVQDVCTRAASRAYQAGLKAAETEGVPGVQALSLGDYSVTYSAEGGGGVGEGVMGASAARMLLLSEKDILAKYRYVAL